MIGSPAKKPKGSPSRLELCQLGGVLDVWTGGRLGGAGTVGSTVVSGTIAPGNSIGTLNVAGNITFNPGSTYEVDIDAAGASDRIVATGTATINGGSVKVLAGAGNYAQQTQYTILTAAGGRSGTFAGVTSNLAFLDPALGYDANNVYLTMTRNGTSFTNVGLTWNQVSAGGGVESLGPGNPVHNAALSLSADQARNAFDQLSGEIHASARTALIEDSRFLRNAVNDRLRAVSGSTAAGDAVVASEKGRPPRRPRPGASRSEVRASAPGAARIATAMRPSWSARLAAFSSVPTPPCPATGTSARSPATAAPMST